MDERRNDRNNGNSNDRNDRGGRGNFNNDRNRGRRRRHRDRRGGRRRERSLDELEREYVNRLRNDGVEKPICALCEKPIIVLNQAIRHRESGKPAHFDCIVRMLRETMRPGPQEKIAYLGGGSFGVIEERNQHGRIRFTVRERLQYEERKRRIERDAPDAAGDAAGTSESAAKSTAAGAAGNTAGVAPSAASSSSDTSSNGPSNAPSDAHGNAPSAGEVKEA
ncbi:MAG: hypothetical protein AABZ39_01515 [Spirochaetota bacterium]